jgi:predicted PurR-regulated permease PerM
VLIALGVCIMIVANEVFLTIGLALVFALGLDPLVTRLTRRGIGRGKAALLVFFALFAVVSVLVIWTAAPIWNEVRGLVDDVPGYIEDLKDEPVVKELLQTRTWRRRRRTWPTTPPGRSPRPPRPCSASRARWWGPR